VQQAQGGTVYVISGFGKPKKYVLWEAFTIEEITKQDDQFVVSGPGRVLLPPAELTGKDFEKFKAACANFIGFRKIDDQTYTATLKKLAEANAKAYGVPFPKHILVDVTTFAWQFGAYTVGEGESAHAVIACTDPANQGLSALEALVHEPSHAIVGGGRSDAIGLWHAILFYTAGETTRRTLDGRGVHDYKPIITLMYDGPFRGFKQPLELHWQAYLDGKVSREEAIRKLVIDCVPPPKKSQ